MGKPFEIELEALPSTYAWAISQPVDQLCRAVERLVAHPMLAVGSGGSFSVCHFAAHLHGVFAGQPAIPSTPLQAVSHRTPIANMGILIPTAGGNNPDVVASVRLLSEQEPQSMLILCGNAGSKVASQAMRYKTLDFISYDLPTGKDGFLATNSLLAFSVLLSRAYLEVSGQSSILPKEYRSLLTNRRIDPYELAAQRRYEDLLGKQTLLVLHGSTTIAAAVDIESKFTEAALGHVKICDFRQFAHGRHHWLAKRSGDTAILSLETPHDKTIADQTLELLPKSVPTTRLSFVHDGWLADLAGLCEGFYLTGVAGRQQGIDPGRPGVPSFGRKLYHANAFRARHPSKMPAWKARAIERKASERVERLAKENRLTFWAKALDTVIDRIHEAQFCGIVLDYDGTLCSEDERFKPLPEEMADALTSLLESGARLGFATGRGKSVTKRLCEALPKKHWPEVTVGYYNGGQILTLDKCDSLDGNDHVAEELSLISKAINSDRLLSRGNITLRYRQITLSNPRGMSLDALTEHVEALVHRVAGNGLRVMRSGHSVDVVPDSVSKVAVVERLLEQSPSGASDAVLRIGDRGRWPGNDAQLLASPYGLSVHQVSSDAYSCWNIAPPGQRGWQATLWYLRHLKVSKRGTRFRLPTFKED
ncbi:MAG: HAD hydrolase family protein [Pirellulales bacterium]|nr:HAD hydrolase family protein [Pirellulales bacterium]